MPRWMLTTEDRWTRARVLTAHCHAARTCSGITRGPEALAHLQACEDALRSGVYWDGRDRIYTEAYRDALLCAWGLA